MNRVEDHFQYGNLHVRMPKPSSGYLKAINQQTPRPRTNPKRIPALKRLTRPFTLEYASLARAIVEKTPQKLTQRLPSTRINGESCTGKEIKKRKKNEQFGYPLLGQRETIVVSCNRSFPNGLGLNLSVFCPLPQKNSHPTSAKPFPEFGPRQHSWNDE